jgi:predicted phosphodiesterase
MQQGVNPAPGARLDLGILDGPVLVFGGPYGNLEATGALIGAARRLGIPPARAICTGDVVAYAADPQGVVDLLRSWGCAIVMGNCEESLARDAADCGCGFAEDSACAALSDQWFNATRRDLDDDTKRWMGTLPRRIDFTLGGRRLAVIHGGVTQINRFIFASTSAAEKSAEIAAADVDGIVAGHCGLPFSQLVGGRLWHNSGALGMPANDGTARVWFSVLTPRADGIHVAHHAFDYDHRAAAAKMYARGYPNAYAAALVDGLWPSCDILPEAERPSRGVAIEPGTLIWPDTTPREAANPQLDREGMPVL